MINKIKKETEERMIECMNFFKKNIKKIHTGRASPSILNNIRIKYFDNIVSLNKIASITVENYLTLKINLFDISLIKLVEKEIINANLGIYPQSIGNIIRVSIPLLTEERRKELIKLVKSESEQSKIFIRNIRREYNDKLKVLVKSKKISTDDEYRSQTIIQKLTDIYIKNINNIYNLKEIELKEF